MTKVHEGSCGNHLGGKVLAPKVLHKGYYWPTLIQSAPEYSKKCSSFQIHANLLGIPTQQLNATKITYPFNHWGIDIVGPLPIEKGGKKQLLQNWWRQ